VRPRRSGSSPCSRTLVSTAVVSMADIKAPPRLLYEAYTGLSPTHKCPSCPHYHYTNSPPSRI
jgi:hypothetical protein